MHISIDRQSALCVALSFAFVFAIAPMAHAVPLPSMSTASEAVPAAEDGQAAADIVNACSQLIVNVSAEATVQIEAEAYAAIPDSVHRAEAAIGTPYRSGSSSPYGFDCSGLVSYCLTGNYGHAYTSYSFWSMPAVADPQPGDVVACSPGHCGLYIGDGLMIHAPQSGECVRVEAIRGKIVRP